MGHDIRAVRYDAPDPQRLAAEVQAEYARRYGGEGDISPMEPDHFAPPCGAFFVLYVDDEPAAMGGWRRGGPNGDDDAEIKRMYVRPQFQRRGLARVMLAHLEAMAAADGITRFVLETGDAQPEAIALYRSSGYVDVDKFGFYAEYDDSVHLGKVLSGTTQNA